MDVKLIYFAKVIRIIELAKYFLPVVFFCVILHSLSRAKAVSKKSIAILSFDRNFGRFYMKEDRAFMLSSLILQKYEK